MDRAANRSVHAVRRVHVEMWRKARGACMDDFRPLYGTHRYDRVGEAHPTARRGKRIYLPIQKRLKITPSKSSGVNSPVMLDS